MPHSSHLVLLERRKYFGIATLSFVEINDRREFRVRPDSAVIINTVNYNYDLQMAVSIWPVLLFVVERSHRSDSINTDDFYQWNDPFDRLSCYYCLLHIIVCKCNGHEVEAWAKFKLKWIRWTSTIIIHQVEVFPADDACEWVTENKSTNACYQLWSGKKRHFYWEYWLRIKKIRLDRNWVDKNFSILNKKCLSYIIEYVF